MDFTVFRNHESFGISFAGPDCRRGLVVLWFSMMMMHPSPSNNPTCKSQDGYTANYSSHNHASLLEKLAAEEDEDEDAGDVSVDASWEAAVLAGSPRLVSAADDGGGGFTSIEPVAGRAVPFGMKVPLPSLQHASPIVPFPQQ